MRGIDTDSHHMLTCTHECATNKRLTFCIQCRRSTLGYCAHTAQMMGSNQAQPSHVYLRIPLQRESGGDNFVGNFRL